MITMTYKDAVEPQFSQAMDKMTSQALPPKLAYAVKKIADGVISQRNKMADEYRKLCVDPYCKRNEDGSIFVPEGADAKRGFQIADEHVPTFMKAQEEFQNTEFSIPRTKLNFKDFEMRNIQFSANDLHALEPIFEYEQVAPVADVAPSNVTPITG